ncbi:hypothetical protein [Cohnella thermotolerans]|uniref:hypothetical protein n=1 Tax=Cohnella thermotolerans TaxID=329858 RepID=UPI0004048F39|nr:hypothetical protein [Cohnella thermotolerans]
MTQIYRQVAAQWIDDYLDLYNFAVQIGDEAWQEEIVGRLRSRETHIRELAEHLALQELWRKFDAINRRMLEIYDQLKSNRDEANVQRLRETVWELKQQRAIIASKIRAHCA